MAFIDMISSFMFNHHPAKKINKTAEILKSSNPQILKSPNPSLISFVTHPG
jgi:hypothetical protein